MGMAYRFWIVFHYHSGAYHDQVLSDISTRPFLGLSVDCIFFSCPCLCHIFLDSIYDFLLAFLSPAFQWIHLQTYSIYLLFFPSHHMTEPSESPFFQLQASSSCIRHSSRILIFDPKLLITQNANFNMFMSATLSLLHLCQFYRLQIMPAFSSDSNLPKSFSLSLSLFFHFL